MRRFIVTASTLAWNDVKQSYRRSRIGQYWITLGMAVQILTIAAVFSIIFKSNLPEYLPFLSVSLILWTYLSSALNEGSKALIEAEAMIKQIPLSPFVHVLKVLLRNLIVLAHNAILIPLVMLVVGRPINLSIVLFPLGLITLTINLYWMSTLIAILSARYRDFPPIVAAVTSALFYVTPVMWLPELLGDDRFAHLLLGLNPFYHLLQVVRQPLLGVYPTMENWAISGILALLGCLVALKVGAIYRRQIAYWV